MKCHVIIPVGPGHQEIVGRAITSVSMAIDTSTGPFDDVRIITIRDHEGSIGRSAARNGAVENTQTDWFFFLDADDMMHPKAFEGFAPHVEREAVWGGCMEYKDGFVQNRLQMPVIRDYQTLIKYDPFMTIKIGHFVRHNVARNTPFDVNMDTGEDWDYYLRVWKRYDAIKIEDPFYIKVAGQHSTGPRSATGRDWNEAVDKLLINARMEAA